MLQCVAVCCRVLPCVAVCYSVLQCVAVFGMLTKSKTHAHAVCYNLGPLLHTATHWNTLQHTATL